MILLAVVLAAAPASAGLEQAVSAVGETFQAALTAPSGALVPAFKRLASLDDEDTLISLLSDRDWSVRAQAARGLKNYALNSWKSENALLERAQDSRELENVRREAIKSLAWAAQHWTTRDSLLRLAADDHETATLRAIALKSLYVVAGDDQARRTLLDALDANQPLALRASAAWALFGSAASDQQAREKLLQLSTDSNEHFAVRVECLKSLYSAMTDWTVKDAVLRLSQDDGGGTPQLVRETSMLLLNAVNQDFQVKDYLEREASGEQNGALRSAAIKALQPGPDMDLVRYFHLSYYQGRFVDPLADQ